MTIITGVAASSGIAKGIARLVLSEKDYSKVKPKDIIVCVTTTPDMVPLMKKASAIVADEGGILSHPSIISRELGIPCIVGAKEATKKIKDNTKITVNGTKGEISF
ncbi:MAG: PEP-utilizing enzyme [Candidatus ainarchaeum sp.]|nr:PEP-utilizing enzyme [Candidatus ainarchaeum sp.]